MRGIGQDRNAVRQKPADNALVFHWTGQGAQFAQGFQAVGIAGWRGR